MTIFTPGAFLAPLQLEYMDGRSWRLAAMFCYRLAEEDGPEEITVPADFVTDFASIPRLLWNILPPTGGYGKAAVLHDWLYATRRVDVRSPAGPGIARTCWRAEADGILWEAMGVAGVPLWQRLVIYTGVRIGGWVAWRAHRKAGDRWRSAPRGVGR